MILSKECPILANEDAGALHDKLMHLGQSTVIETLELIEKQEINTTLQVDAQDIQTAYKLNKDNCKIDFSKTGAEIHNLIRGLSPYPSAWCFIHNNKEEWNVKIYEADFVMENHDFEIGQLIATKKELKIAVINGLLDIKSIQFPGKKRMKTHEILNGMTFESTAKAL